MHKAQKFAWVVVPSPLKEPLIYGIPESIQPLVVPGTRVLVPLQQRIVTGVVLEVVNDTSIDRVKQIVATQDDQPIVDHDLLKLSQWIAQYYLAPIGEVLAAMLPPNSQRKSERTVILKLNSCAAEGAFEQRVLDKLQQHKGKMSVKTLTREFAPKNLERILKRLESLGAIEIEDRLPGQRKRQEVTGAAADLSAQEPARLTLTSEQEGALRAIENSIGKGGFETFLLHGVTGSGKTEVYLRAMERVRETGRRSLILIPEISLTPQLLDRLNSRFRGKVGVLHSALTGAARWAQWWHISRGNVDVVVGARSAVFAPIPNLGLIVVDEEHDPSYKQEEGLKYNGRDVAVVRAKLLGCPIILGSATPALESYENCRQGRYRLLEITQRVQQRPLPAIEAVDLRLQPRALGVALTPAQTDSTVGHKRADGQLMSEEFVHALRQNLQRERQTLIFLNRRGFSNFVQCSLCGYVWRCSYCSVTLTLHSRQKQISCHHCDFRRPITDICPGCGNASLSGIGVGTEQVEQLLHRLVPEARIARMDRDTTRKRGSQEDLIRRWERGEIDILVGTQMITKGHDVSGVTLVGALLADLSLNLPDFRAAERTFQLLSQVAGRSGRGDDPGRVIIQTYAPDHYVIQQLITHDYKGFFAAEIEFRRALNYPPFGRLVNLRIDGPKLEEVESKAKALAKNLRDLQARTPKFSGQIEVLGPAPAPIQKLRNRYRWQLLLKGKQISTLLEFTKQARQCFPRGRTSRLHIDVDPYNML